MAPLLGPRDFYSTRHVVLYERMLALGARHELDLATLNHDLLERGELEQLGGTEWLAGLADVVPSAGNAEYFARQLVRDTLRRDVVELGRRLMDYGLETAPTTDDEFAAEVERRVLEVTQARVGRGRARWMREIFSEVWDRVSHPERYGAPGIPTGYRDLDEMLSPGLAPGSLVLVAGRSSMGKSSLAWGMATNMARTGVRVGIFSVEMESLQLGVNVASANSRVPNTVIREGHRYMSADERQSLMETIEAGEGWPILVDDYPGYTVADVRAIARRWVAREQIQVVMLDYVQLLRATDPRAPRHDQVAEISRSLKSMARELEIPVLAVSQLNREAERRQDKRPMLSDLKASGGLEEDADQVMLIWRPHYYDESAPREQAIVIVAKNRNGPTGEVELRFEREFVRFGDRE